MSAALRLEIFQNGQLLQEVPVNANQPDADVWVGRDEGCVIRLEDRAISRKHALFRTVNGGGIEFEKKSKFGSVKLNGADSTRAFLKNGDCLDLGGAYEIRVKEIAAPAPPPIAEKPVPKMAVVPAPPVEPVVESAEFSESPAGVVELNSSADGFSTEGEAAPAEESNEFAFQNSAPEGVEEVAPHSDAPSDFGASSGGDFTSAVSHEGATRVFSVPERVKAVLEFGSGTAESSLYEINDEEVAIGRSQQCHVVLEDKKSSRKHVILKREGQTYILKDLGSANGTLVNDVRVDSEQELHSGDRIQIGETVFVFKVVQANYEQEKQNFIPAPAPEVVQSAPAAYAATPHALSVDAPPSFYQDMAAAPGAAPIPEPAQFEAPPEKKKSLIGKMLDRYRSMNTRQQIIWGVLIIGGCYLFMFDDDEATKHAKLNVNQKKAVQKKDDKKLGGPTFETLTPEQQRYIDTQYQLAFELYKNREYDKCLLELNGIFNLVKDYKNAHEIESFAREGKRKLEAQEDERKRKEAERQAQLKLQSMIEQAGLLMDKKRFKEAEALFPEIELLQPENAAVSEWRKQIMVEAEKFEAEQSEKKRQLEISRQNWAEFQKGKALADQKQYIDALEVYDELVARPNLEKKLSSSVKEETLKLEGILASLRDPLLQEGKQLEQDGKLSEAYRAYEKAVEVDPADVTAPESMKRIRGTLTAKAKYLYTEGVFAESYSDMEAAEKKFREVLEVVPKEDDYYAKAQIRLKRITVLRKPASEGAQ